MLKNLNITHEPRADLGTLSPSVSFQVMRALNKLLTDKTINELQFLGSNSLELLANNLVFFQDDPLSNEVALELLNSGHQKEMVKFIESFKELDSKVALKLIVLGREDNFFYRDIIFSKNHCFKTLNSEVALMLINSIVGADPTNSIIIGMIFGGFFEDSSSIFQELDIRVALRLIEIGHGSLVVNNLKKYVGIDHKELVMNLIKAGDGNTVAAKISEFNDIDHNEIALMLIKSGNGAKLAAYLEDFNGLDHQEIALKLIEAGNWCHLARNLESFEGLDHQEIALKLIEAGNGGSLIRNLESFEGLDHQEIAVKLIEAGEGRIVIEYLQSFKGLGIEVAKKLVLAGYIEDVDRLAGELGIPLTNIAAFRPSDLLLLSDLNLDTLPKERSAREAFYQKAFTIIKSAWKDEQNIVIPFVKLAELIGFEAAFKYISNPKISRHDACFALPKISECIGMFCTTEEQASVTRNLLLQVGRDKAIYPSGSAHHHLNEISQRGVLLPEVLVSKIESDLELKANDSLLTLAKGFQTPGVVTSAWNSFKQYFELSYLVSSQVDLLKSIGRLRTEGKQKLADYVETLGFHKGASVSIDQVLSFAFKPQEFFENHDEHAIAEKHDRKKPSNYVNIPHLDLTSDELRDALVEGTLDKIQVLPKYSVSYQVPRDGMILESEIKSGNIKDLIRRGLGSRRGGVNGLIDDQRLGQVFQRLQSLANEDASVSLGRKLKFNEEFLNGDYNVSQDVENKMRHVLREGLEASNKIDIIGVRFVATVHTKSSPIAVLAGNDTACCMPFGSGKNNVYMFNPNCVQFTLEEINEREPRTVAQSVLTLNLESGQKVNELLSEVDPLALSKMVSLYQKGKRQIVCDSVEENKNFSMQEGAHKLIQEIYKDFFSRYFDKLPEELSEGHLLDKDRVIVGTNYSPSFSGYSKVVDNTFIPLAPASYHDNVGKEAYEVIPTKSKRLKVVAEGNIQESNHNTTFEYVSHITSHDSLAIGALEGKIYGNSSLITGLSNLENTIIATEINEQHKGRHRLSFKAQDSNGATQGYIIAYEGKYNNSEERTVYIADFATTKDMPLAGSMIMKRFMQAFSDAYMREDHNLPTISFDARQSTSEKIIGLYCSMFKKHFGCNVDVEKGQSYENGTDTMTPVVLKIVPNVFRH